MTGRVFVIGASGVIGGAHMRRLAGRGLPVVGLSRTNAGTGLEEIHTDLLGDTTGSPLLKDVSHAVFAGFVAADTEQAVRRKNAALFDATLDYLEKWCPNLRHVALLQGMKAYGSNLGPFKTPARESDPRIPGGHYYDDQLDSLKQRALETGWQWTALRPHVVIGPARRSPQNLIVVLGVYASLMKARGHRLDFPGPEAAFDIIYQATDADLLSQAIEWSGSDPRAAGEVFNITNGDFFRWRHVWPKIAAVFDMEPGGPLDVSLNERMVGAGESWKALTRTHQLQPTSLDQLVSWPFADYIFGTTWDVMADTLKCRQAGFLTFLDSEQMIIDRLQELKALKIIP